MSRERLFAERPASVTIGLLGGQTKLGEISQYVPEGAEVVLRTPQRQPDGGVDVIEESIPSETVAYVGFYRETHAAEVPDAASLREYEVHVAAGKKFTVNTVPAGLTDAVGFFGYPAGKHSVFSEMFFYGRGVLGLEDGTPIGHMLVEDGLIDTEALTRAIAEQEAARNVRLGEVLVEQRAVSQEDVEAAIRSQRRGPRRGQPMRLGEILVEANLATEEDIENALKEQRKRKGKRLGEVLVALGIVEEQDVAKTLAAKFHLASVNLDECAIDPDAINEVPLGIVEQYGVFPYQSDDTTLYIAMADPLAMEALEMLKFSVPKNIVQVVVGPAQLDRYIAPFRAPPEEELDEHRIDGWDELVQALEPGTDRTKRGARGKESGDDVAGSAITKLVNRTIADAYRRGASDIHIEPNGKERPLLVRLRIDGVCEVYQTLPAAVRNQIVARVKILANLDITERRRPQDGKIRFPMGNRRIDLRVATIPTATGDEDVVLRILAGSELMKVEKLGLSEHNTIEALRAFKRPYGLILVVGPTGSGKTTTLHSLLGTINDNVRKIWTAEDPVEITQRGLRQVQVNPKIDFTFASAMRAFLRADPDVIMVGEMRDRETAAMGVEASLTGHLVLSTLHTNSAPETIIRLVDMGLDPFSFSDALLVVIAQRLVRRLCVECREEYPLGGAELEELANYYGAESLQERMRGGTVKLWRATGCNACDHKGYSGRAGIHELLVNDAWIRSSIQRKKPADEIRKLAQQGGMKTLLEDGFDKCEAGITDLKQVLAACAV